MAEGEEESKLSLSNNGLVVRSVVDSGKSYEDYRQDLRRDFFWSCCYCTMTEIEASTIKFHIDHYIPQSVDPSLVDEYSNLYYACELCNVAKGDIYPPDDARKAGIRFLKADEDIYVQHIRCEGIRLDELTPVGAFTIEYADLNRKVLLDLRRLRKAAFECEEYVREGMRGLLSFPIDELPPTFRARALQSVKALDQSSSELSDSINEVLKMLSASHFVDPDPEQVKRSNARAGKFKQLRGMYPGDWRGREVRKKS